MTTNQTEIPRAGVTLEMKIPLWGVMTVIGSGVLLIMGLYFNVQALTVAVNELQITVKSGNTAFSVLSGEMSLQKFRLGSVETDLARLNEMFRQQQGGKK